MTTAPAAPAAPASLIRIVDISAKSTDVFGRVALTARNHHFIADGPVANGCPGEALTPPELLFTAVAACAVELIQVIAKENERIVGRIDVAVRGVVDRGNQARTDVTLYNEVTMDFTIAADADTANFLVEGFKKRCPIYGTVSTATGKGMSVRVRTV
jgi:uncharacterized OsmC-like protein